MPVSVDTQTEKMWSDLVSRFEYWRPTRWTKYERIPRRLWEQAASLSTVFSISRVAQALRLSHGDPKKHRDAYLAPCHPTRRHRRSEVS